MNYVKNNVKLVLIAKGIAVLLAIKIISDLFNLYTVFTSNTKCIFSNSSNVIVISPYTFADLLIYSKGPCVPLLYINRTI